jgi:hypothetical protein
MWCIASSKCDWYAVSRAAILPSRSDVVRTASENKVMVGYGTDRTRQRVSSPLYSVERRSLRQSTCRGMEGLDAVEKPKASKFFARFHRATVIAESVFLRIHWGMRRLAPRERGSSSRRLALHRSIPAMIRPDDLPVMVDVPVRHGTAWLPARMMDPIVCVDHDACHADPICGSTENL